MTSRRDELRAQCNAFHQDHPEVWEAFVYYAGKAWDAGLRRYSADAIMHRVRWELQVEKGENEFAVNNNFVSFYARRFLRENPDMGDFFELREQTSQEAPAREAPEPVERNEQLALRIRQQAREMRSRLPRGED